MCNDCLPPVGRPYDVRISGNDSLLVRTEEDRNGASFMLTAVSAECVVFQKPGRLGEAACDYPFYDAGWKERYGRAEYETALGAYVYEALYAVAHALMGGIQKKTARPFSYHGHAVCVLMIGPGHIQFLDLSDSQHHAFDPARTRRLGDGVCPADSLSLQLAFFAELVWHALDAPAQLPLALIGGAA